MAIEILPEHSQGNTSSIGSIFRPAMSASRECTTFQTVIRPAVQGGRDAGLGDGNCLLLHDLITRRVMEGGMRI